MGCAAGCFLSSFLCASRCNLALGPDRVYNKHDTALHGTVPVTYIWPWGQIAYFCCPCHDAFDEEIDIERPSFLDPLLSSHHGEDF
jgi:hypothetical protein